MFQYARKRELGATSAPHPSVFSRQAPLLHAFSSVVQAPDTRDSLRKLGPSTRKLINKAHEGAVICLSLDDVEQRYLLGGAADSSIAIYDLQVGALHGPAQVRAVAQARRGVAGGHKGMVTSISWYPVDTGMFVTGAFDNEVKVWDTNVFLPACRFVLPNKVFAVGMSAVATTHCLIAAAGEDAAVKLCDPATGGFSHTLQGHRRDIWALSWSLQSEYQLLSGDRAGQVRVWDIRRSGTMALLDQHCTTPPPRPSGSSSSRQTSVPHLPGTASPAPQPPSNPTALAHDGAITAILPTPNAAHWLTAATDDRVRMWGAATLHNCLVHYPGAFNRAMRGRQMAVTEDGSTVFCPSGSVVQAFDVGSGDLVGTLKEGHYESVNCCCWNSRMQELYSGANDCQVLVWDVPDAGPGGAQQDGDQDRWSD